MYGFSCHPIHPQIGIDPLEYTHHCRVYRHLVEKSLYNRRLLTLPCFAFIAEPSRITPGKHTKERLVYEPEHEEAIEAECEITDLDPQKKSSQTLNRWLHGQRFSFRTRLCMALFTILGVALFFWLLVSPLHLTRASHGPIFTP